MTAGSLKCPQLLPLDPVLNRGGIDPADLAYFESCKKRLARHTDNVSIQSSEIWDLQIPDTPSPKV
jgi:hypothetical protein